MGNLDREPDSSMPTVTELRKLLGDRICRQLGVFGAAHPELPLAFSHSAVLLFLLLFPTFFVLLELIQEDHTLGALDTTIMVAIFLLIVTILLAYGA